MEKRLLYNPLIENNNKIIIVTNEDSSNHCLSSFFSCTNYNYIKVTNSLEAIDLIRKEHFDLMILDFNLFPILNEQVIEEIRKFSQELSILLLISSYDSIPSLEFMKKMNIQGYCENSSHFSQLSLLIDSTFTLIHQKNEMKRLHSELEQTYEKLHQSYIDNIEALRYTVEVKDPYTSGHSDRVSEYSVLLGKYMGLIEDDINLLRIGGLFHDIGKIGVPDEILKKVGKLSEDEYSEIKKHPNIGVHILSSATIFQEILPIVKYHHEKYDGSGYPENLKGEAIPLLARITAISDSFDAMTSKRTYRDSLSLEEVISEFKRCRSTQFDPNLTDLFLSILENHYDEIQDIQNQNSSELTLN